MLLCLSIHPESMAGMGSLNDTSLIVLCEKIPH